MRHHQLGAAHSVTDAVFDVKADLHRSTPAPRKSCSDGRLAICSSEWENNYPRTAWKTPTSWSMQRAWRRWVENPGKNARLRIDRI
jgi:hypothetical protein